MEKITVYMKNFFRIYARITAWTIFATSSFITVFWGWDLDLNVGLLWQMQMIVFVCTAGSILIVGEMDVDSKKVVLIKFILNYLYVNGVIMSGGFYFDWFSFSNWKMVVSMQLLIAIGYLIIVIFGFYVANREAEQMNQKLAEKERLENQK